MGREYLILAIYNSDSKDKVKVDLQLGFLSLFAKVENYWRQNSIILNKNIKLLKEELV